MPVVLYNLPGSSPCCFVHSVAKHVGVELEIKILDFAKKEHLGEAFLKVNPFHKVPSIDDGGFCVYESTAIAYYLMRKYAPQSDLYPKCLQACTRIDQTLATLAGSIQTDSRAFFRSRFFLKTKPTDQETAGYEENVLKGYEKLVGEGKFAVGDKLSLADIALVAYLAIPIEVGVVDSGKFPKLHSYYQRVKSLLPYFEEVYRPAITHAQQTWKQMK
ncbi:glutathione S-transferase 1-1-like [Haemaphysalis longicornis]